MSDRLRTLAQLTLPGSNTRAVWLLGLFVAVQIADAAQTAVGISRFGPAVEANPVLSFYVTAFGAGNALVGAKAIAIAGGAALHVRSCYLILAVLTVASIFAAVVPWAVVLNG